MTMKANARVPIRIPAFSRTTIAPTGASGRPVALDQGPLDAVDQEDEKEACRK